MTYSATKFEVAISNRLRDIFFKKLHYLTFDLGVKAIRHVAQYPLHHVTYLATEFKAATSNCLGGETIYKKRDGGTDGWTDGWTTDRLWYGINIPIFTNENSGYNQYINTDDRFNVCNLFSV